MSGNNIRGLTVEIAADATQFKKEMDAVRKDAKSSQAELSALQKSLQLNFDGDKLARAQKVAQEAIDKTADAAEKLRERLRYLEETGNADTSAYRKLQTELAQTELKVEQLQEELKELDNLKFTQLGGQIKGIGNKITSVGQALTPLSVAAGAAITGVGALGVSAASTGAEIDDLSLRLGVSAEKIQEWQYIAMQTGVDSEVFNKALIKIRASMLDMSTGTENAASKALRSLGLSMEQFSSQEEMFDGVMAALTGMEDKTLQAAYANEIFGDKIANQMLPYLNAGAEEIAQFKDEFAGIGALSTEQVKKLAELDDTFNLLKASIKNVGVQIGTAFQPLLKELADTMQNSIIPKLQSLAEWFGNLTVGQQKFALGAALVVAALAPVTIGIGKLVTAIGSIIQIIPTLKAGLTALSSHPIILIIAAVVAVLLLLYTTCEDFRESINSLFALLGSVLSPVLDLVIYLLNAIMSLLSPILDLVGGILATIINLVVEALSPFAELLQALMSILTPLINVALIPLQLVLSALQVPLQILGTLLNWLMPLFTLFANIVRGVFLVVLEIINFVLGVIEDAINWVIGVINGLIDGVNSALGWLGVNIGRIGEVNLRIDTSSLQDLPDATIDTTAPDISTTTPPTTSDNIYDDIDTSGVVNNQNNYDNSTHNTTQNVTVTIQNYAEEVDVDNLVRQINIKLAEAM